MANERTPLLAVGIFPGPKLLWRVGAIFATVGMISGAFGAHGLKKRAGMNADKVHNWETAAHYSIFNGLTLLLLSMHPRFSAHRFAGPVIAVGGLIFSSSVMALVLDRDRFRFLGPVTPMGGAVMIAGYVSLLF